MDCEIFPSGNPKKQPYVFVLHGIAGTKYSYRKLKKRLNKRGYTVIACEGHPLNWEKTVNEYDSLIRSLAKPSILIGTSMGAAESLVIGSRNPYVKKVFAFAPPYDLTSFKPLHNGIVKFGKSIFNALPVKNIICNVTNVNKFFLGHNPSDKIIPLAEFNKVRNALFGCVPDASKNVAEFDNVSHLDYLDTEKTWKFIESRLEDMKNE